MGVWMSCDKTKSSMTFVRPKMRVREARNASFIENNNKFDRASAERVGLSEYDTLRGGGRERLFCRNLTVDLLSLHTQKRDRKCPRVECMAPERANTRAYTTSDTAQHKPGQHHKIETRMKHAFKQSTYLYTSRRCAVPDT